MNYRKTIPVLAAALLICSAFLLQVAPVHAVPAASPEAGGQVLPSADDPPAGSDLAPSAPPPFPPGPPGPPGPMPPAPPAPAPAHWPPQPYPYPSPVYPYYPSPSPCGQPCASPCGDPCYQYDSCGCCDNCRWYVNPRQVTHVVVVQAPPAPVCIPTIISFTSQPSCLQQCQSSVLSWTVNNATSVTISPTVGSVSGSGSYTVSPTSTTTYMLTATNTGGSVTASTTVVVTPAVTTYNTTASPTVTTTSTSVLTGGISAFGNLPANQWLMYMLLLGLLVVAVGVIIFLNARKPAPAYAGHSAGTRTGYVAAATATATAPATGTSAQTMPIGTMSAARLVTERGDSIPLTGGVQTLGRNDFRAILAAEKAAMISRNHIQMEYTSGRYYIEDRDSTNGTRLNGSNIRGKGRYTLQDGDTVDLGGAINLIFRA